MSDIKQNHINLYNNSRREAMLIAKELGNIDDVCKLKKKFTTRKNAKDFVKKINKTSLLKVYKCTVCGLYHTSTRIKE